MKIAKYSNRVRGWEFTGSFCAFNVFSLVQAQVSSVAIFWRLLSQCFANISRRADKGKDGLVS